MTRLMMVCGRQFYRFACRPHWAAVVAILLFAGLPIRGWADEAVVSEKTFLDNELTKWQVAFPSDKGYADLEKWEAFKSVLFTALRAREISPQTVEKMRMFSPASPCWDRGDDRAMLLEALRVWAYGSDERKAIVNRARQETAEDAEQAVALRIEALQTAKKEASLALFDAMRLRLECATRLADKDERRDQLLLPLVTLYQRRSWMYDVGVYNPHLRPRYWEMFMQAVVLWANSHPQQKDAIAVPLYMDVMSPNAFDDLPKDFLQASDHYQSAGLAQFKADVYGAECALNWLVDDGGIKSDHHRMVLREALKLTKQYSADVTSVHKGYMIKSNTQLYHMRDVEARARY